MLADAGVADAAIDAKELYCYMEGLDRTGLMMAWQRILQDNQCEAYFKLVEERASRVPLQHITGTQEFMGLPFAVNGDVLIPRQDTETMVEDALELLKSGSLRGQPSQRLASSVQNVPFALDGLGICHKRCHSNSSYIVVRAGSARPINNLCFHTISMDIIIWQNRFVNTFFNL